VAVVRHENIFFIVVDSNFCAEIFRDQLFSMDRAAKIRLRLCPLVTSVSKICKRVMNYAVPLLLRLQSRGELEDGSGAASATPSSCPIEVALIVPH
jgi:hypothetical protein